MSVLEIYSITVYLVKDLSMNHSFIALYSSLKGAMLPSTSLLGLFSRSEWGYSYTDTNVELAPLLSLRAMGCIERGRTMWNVKVLNIISYSVR